MAEPSKGKGAGHCACPLFFSSQNSSTVTNRAGGFSPARQT